VQFAFLHPPNHPHLRGRGYRGIADCDCSQYIHFNLLLIAFLKHHGNDQILRKLQIDPVLSTVPETEPGHVGTCDVCISQSSTMDSFLQTVFSITMMSVKYV
jgi:hypothetical protein